MAGLRQFLELFIRADTSQARNSIRNFQTTYTELLSQVQLAEQVFTIAGNVAKDAFDFGQQGATVIQTAESFDLLLEKVGAAPDLLAQLRDAAGGTISDLQLMSSTSTLLAGAQGDVATSLANATPQLLEIARAANKLNPSLGSTAFLYESIATGIKRSSPLILDNLGLTIKIGEANEEYAASLGKSVEELTAQEKQVALLNATLEAGNTLIGQVGGNLDSATDSYGKLTASIENAKNAMAERFTPSITRAVDAIALLVGWQDQLNNAFADHAGNVLESSDSYESYVTEIQRAADAAGVTAYTVEQLDQIVRAGGESILETSDYFVIMSESSYIAAQNINTADDAVRSLTGALNPAQEGMLGLGPAVDGVGDALGDASGEADGFSESLNALEANLNLDSAIEKMIEQLEFAAAGGLELQNQLNAAIQAYNDPQNVRYGDDVWLNQVLAAAFVEAQELQVALGNITADEAAQNIANTLNISLSEARNLMNGIVDGLNNLNGQEFSAEFSIFVSGLSNLREAWRLLGLVGGAGGGGGSVGGGILFDQVGGPVGAGQLAFVGEAGREIFIPQGATSGTGDDIILIGEDGPTLFIPEKSGHILSNSETEAILRGDRTIPKYEHGGPVGAGQLAIVGERGPELFVPNQSGTVISNEQLAGLGQHNTFIINDAMAAALILADQDIMRRDRFNNRMGI